MYNYNMHEAVLRCRYLCPCGLDTRTAKQMRAVHQQYYQALKRLIEDSGRYDNKKDFTVVLQPFMADQTAPKDVSSECLSRLCRGGGLVLFLEMFWCVISKIVKLRSQIQMVGSNVCGNY